MFFFPHFTQLLFLPKQVYWDQRRPVTWARPTLDQRGGGERNVPNFGKTPMMYHSPFSPNWTVRGAMTASGNSDDRLRYSAPERFLHPSPVTITDLTSPHRQAWACCAWFTETASIYMKDIHVAICIWLRSQLLLQATGSTPSTPYAENIPEGSGLAFWTRCPRPRGRAEERDVVPYAKGGHR